MATTKLPRQMLTGNLFTSLSSSATTVLDFSGGWTIGVLDGLATNTTVSTTSLAAGSSYALRIKDNGVSRTLTFPGTWTWLTTPPASTTVSKWVLITLECLNADTPVILADWKLADTAATLAEYQPLDSDLTAIAALSTASFGRGLLTEASASSARTTLGLGSAATVADSWTGTGVSTGDVAFEIGASRTGSGNVYIDMHAVNATDYEARILRLGGANGAFTIYNTGTGDYTFTQANAGAFAWSINSVEVERLTSTGVSYTVPVTTTGLRTGVTTDATAGIINQLSSANGFARLTGAAPDLRGIAATTGTCGQVSVWFQNASTIRHAAGTAAAADRITTNTGADIAIGAGSTVMFIYDTTSAVWRPVRG